MDASTTMTDVTIAPFMRTATSRGMMPLPMAATIGGYAPGCWVVVRASRRRKHSSQSGKKHHACGAGGPHPQGRQSIRPTPRRAVAHSRYSLAGGKGR